ncbi:MAG: hypothetical protein WC565_00380 [Parcubacteria group bacterium]
MSLLIKGGEVIDGLGGAPKKSDVLIIGRRIAALGDFPAYKANRIISATGSLIFPGFIDISSVSDHRLSLLSEPDQADFLRQGVTTIVCGAEGKSLAPAMYAGDVSSSNAGWRGMGEYLNSVQTLHPGVNFTSFLGYETLRRSLTPKPRNLGVKEIGVLSHILGQEFADNSVGVSVGDRGFAEFDASEEELNTLKNILLKENKTAFIPLSAEDKSYAPFAESGIKVIIGNLNGSLSSASAFEKIVNAIERKSPKAEFAFSFSPYPYHRFKAADILPKSVNREKSVGLIDALKKKRFFGFLSKRTRAFDPQETFIFSAPRKEMKFLLGKSVAEFAANRGIVPEEAFVRIVSMCGADTEFLTRMADRELIEKIASHGRSIIGSSGWSPMSKISIKHRELSDPFAEFIRLSDRLGIRPELVGKKLSAPARILGFRKRGVIKEGYAADITIVKNNRPEITIVNGEIAFEEGSFNNVHSGEIVNI